MLWRPPPAAWVRCAVFAEAAAAVAARTAKERTCRGLVPGHKTVLSRVFSNKSTFLCKWLGLLQLAQAPEEKQAVSFGLKVLRLQTALLSLGGENQRKTTPFWLLLCFPLSPVWSLPLLWPRGGGMKQSYCCCWNPVAPQSSEGPVDWQQSPCLAVVLLLPVSFHDHSLCTTESPDLQVKRP